MKSEMILHFACLFSIFNYVKFISNCQATAMVAGMFGAVFATGSAVGPVFGAGLTQWAGFPTGSVILGCIAFTGACVAWLAKPNNSANLGSEAADLGSNSDLDGRFEPKSGVSQGFRVLPPAQGVRVLELET